MHVPFEIIGVKNDMNVGLKSSNSNRLLYNIKTVLEKNWTIHSAAETDRPYTPVFNSAEFCINFLIMK